MTRLTPTQQRLVDGIKAFKARKGYPPTVRELAAEVGLSSPSTVHHHLDALERAGAITRQPNMPRTIVVDPTENNDDQPVPDRPEAPPGSSADDTVSDRPAGS